MKHWNTSSARIFSRRENDMAVDIKSLRIGSHINLCSKRRRITAIDALNGLLGIDAYKTDENGVKYPIGYKVEDVEPISITPEILTEIGFKYHEYDNGKLWEWDLPDGYKDYGYLEFDEGTATIWRGRLWNMKEIEVEFKVEYLHDLENIFYMFYGVELIKE